MISIAGLTDLFDFEPGSRIGTAKKNCSVPYYSRVAGMQYTHFLKGDVCEINENSITNISANERFAGQRAATQPEVVLCEGHQVSGTKSVSRSSWGNCLRPNSRYKSTAEQSSEFWDWSRWLEPSMFKDVPTQAILMDELAKEARDNARYNAVPSNFVRSKVERF